MTRLSKRRLVRAAAAAAALSLLSAMPVQGGLLDMASTAWGAKNLHDDKKTLLGRLVGAFGTSAAGVIEDDESKFERGQGMTREAQADFFKDQVTVLGIPILKAGDAVAAVKEGVKKRLDAVRRKVGRFFGKTGEADARAALAVGGDERHLSRAGILGKRPLPTARVSAPAAPGPGLGGAPSPDPWAAAAWRPARGASTAARRPPAEVAAVAAHALGCSNVYIDRFSLAYDEFKARMQRRRATGADVNCSEVEARGKDAPEKTDSAATAPKGSVSDLLKGRPGERYGVIDDDEAGDPADDYRAKLKAMEDGGAGDGADDYRAKPGAAGGTADYASALDALGREAEERERRARLEKKRRSVAPADRAMRATRAADTRSGPGEEYERAGRLRAGEEVRVTGELGAWRRVEAGDGTRGFVLGAALMEAGSRWADGETFRDCPECPEMVVVPAGSFTMGSPPSEEDRFDNEGPVRRVTFAEPFAVGVYEVTFAEWDACVSGGGCGGYRPDDEGWGRGNRPVINVSWKDARAYVAWLSEKTGEEYRLLSESEWEYAARAGTTTRYSWGDRVGSNRANCGRNYCGDSWEYTAPVGSFAANEWGLRDMHGNVGEWVEDCWNGSYAGAPSDGRAWVSGECGSRVLRGGAWYNYPWLLRSARRVGFDSGYRSNYLGVRVARTLAP